MKELKEFFFKPLFDMCGMDSKCKHFHSQKIKKKVAAVLFLLLFSHIFLHSVRFSLAHLLLFFFSLIVVIAAAIIIMKKTEKIKQASKLY